MDKKTPYDVVTVTPNPAIDWMLTVPAFAVGAVNRVVGERREAGGKGVNVAVALAAFGHRVAATGFLGRDTAAPFEALFARWGIADRFVRLDGATRVDVKLVDPAQGETTDVNLPGLAVTTEAVEALKEKLRGLALPGRWVVLAGSLPPGVAPTLYRDLVLNQKDAGSRVLLDTSGDALRHALEAAPHVVKPNVHELEALAGRALPTREAVVEAARGLLARGVERVVVSMGAEGALFVAGDEALWARPPQAAVLSTAGAGDAMVAGVVAAERAGLALPDVARWATAFARHVLTHGREAPLTAEALEGLAAGVEVERA